jgi:hypothetical protein
MAEQSQIDPRTQQLEARLSIFAMLRLAEEQRAKAR